MSVKIRVIDLQKEEDFLGTRMMNDFGSVLKGAGKFVSQPSTGTRCSNIKGIYIHSVHSS